MEDLRRKAYTGDQPAYRYTGRGYCPVCEIKSEHALDFDKVSKSFPAWTVPRDFWEQALKPEISGIAVDIKLFHESGRRLVHKYRVYLDPLPHPALREGRISRLISLANRAMAIAQLKHLRIAIPSSGNVPGEVPIDCFP